MTGTNKKNNKGILLKPKVTLIIGVILITVGIVNILKFWPFFLVVFKGCIGLALVMLGALAILMARQ